MADSSGGWAKGVAAIGVLAAGLGVGYYFGIFLPARDAARGEAVSACMAAADAQYHEDWVSSCKEMKLGEDCKLPRLLASANDERRSKSVEECYRQ